MVHDANHEEHEALLQVCICGWVEFVVYVLMDANGNGHPHLQCTHCHESYCKNDGPCSLGSASVL